MMRLTIAILFVAFIASCSYQQPIIVGQLDSDYYRGKSDGEAAAVANPMWAAAGLGCGIFGIGAAYLNEPNVPQEPLVNKSESYKAGYTSGYRAKAKNTNLTYSLAGWATWLLFYVVMSAE
jgi:hypothetical protein